SGLKDYPQCDVQVKELAAAVWGKCDGVTVKQQVYGKGNIYWNVPVKDILNEKGIRPDFIYDNENAYIDFIHRSVGDTDIYFIANRNNREEKAVCSFRVTGKTPELWDATIGEAGKIAGYKVEGDHTKIELLFAPFQSWFIIFRKPDVKDKYTTPVTNLLRPMTPVQELGGAWTVHFDTEWGGPASIQFDKLEDWTQRPEENIKYYSGKARYVKHFDIPNFQKGKLYHLDLGVVKNIAEITLNGRKLGILWTAPWRVPARGLLKSTGNVLEIVVVNCWPNRLIGDAALPPQKRLTRTNIVFKKDAPLMSSGLLGPVVIAEAK
ncbi:MAG TPA: glycosyl hydrolase, partial [Niastella sp.]